MNSGEKAGVFVFLMFLLFLVIGIGAAALFSQTDQEHREYMIPYYADFIHQCVDNGGSVIETYRGEVSCEFPAGILPPDLNGH